MMRYDQQLIRNIEISGIDQKYKQVCEDHTISMPEFKKQDVDGWAVYRVYRVYDDRGKQKDIIDNHLKYKTKYLELKNIDVNNQIGGQYIKKILYENDNFLAQNNIDSDILGMDSTFLIGSITKIFTVYVILILHQKYLLNINDNVIKYIETKNKNNNVTFEKITILDLINHTSGLKGMPDNKKSIYTPHKTAYSCMNTFINGSIRNPPYLFFQLS